jgi:hypothetical protein
MVFGPMKNFIKLFLFIFISIVIFSCKKNKTDYSCDNVQTIQTDFASPYNDWFNELPSDNSSYLNIISSDSLSDAFDLVKYNDYIDDFTLSNFVQNDDPCTKYNFEYTYMDYKSSIYDFVMRVMLVQMNDGVHIRIDDNSSQKYGYIFMDYNISTSSASNIIFFESGAQTSTYKPSIEIIPSLTSNNIMYQYVYKITNNLTLNEGNKFDVTTFYIDQYWGLIKFTQKCGDTWDVEF